VFFVVTVIANLASAKYWPMYVTDAFTWQMLAASIGPVISGFSIFFLYRTTRERYVSWLAVAGAILWLFTILCPAAEYWGRGDRFLTT